MTIKDMHYDFKKKLNKIDSQKYRNLRIPEIDWVLNEAQELFVKLVAQPRLKTQLGVETTQRTIDDIKALVVHNQCLVVNSNIVSLPKDYLYFLRGRIKMNKGECCNIEGIFYPMQHDDEFEESYFDKSSFEWRTVNGLFTREGIQLFDDGTFENKELCLSYIKRPLYMHNAEDYSNGKYKLPSGKELIGTQDCELVEDTHREIVDIAVFITAGELQMPDYQLKLAKLQLNQLT